MALFCPEQQLSFCGINEARETLIYEITNNEFPARGLFMPFPCQSDKGPVGVSVFLDNLPWLSRLLLLFIVPGAHQHF